MELVAQLEGREAVVPHQGGIWYQAVRDAAHLREAKRWKRRLAAAHPDGGGTDKEFVRVQKQCERWHQEEARVYAEYGRVPPAFGTVNAVPTKRRVCSPRAVLGLLRQSPLTVEEVAAALSLEGSCAPARVRMAVQKLRWQGAIIATVAFQYNEPHYYVLVSDSDYKERLL